MNDHEPHNLARHWLDAAASADIARDLESIYAVASRRIAERGPACWASGRCCNFEKTGHLLYVTGLEAAYCIARLAGSEWDRRGRVALSVDGQHQPIPSGRGLVADLASARSRGGCPFQVGNLCGVHAIKPLGCRLYFCDRSAQDWQQELSEELLADIRSLHDRHGVEYRYGEWRGMIGLFDAGKAEGGNSEEGREGRNSEEGND